MDILIGTGANTSLNQLANTYDVWAKKYETDMLTLGYPGPDNMAKVVKELSPVINNEVKILDLAAGTGLVGVSLRNVGFTNIDAGDMSTEILKEAKAKGIYKRILKCVMGEGPIDAEPDTYDFVTICGCFSVPVHTSVFTDLYKIVKPGGYLVINFRPDIWAKNDVYGYREALLGEKSPWVLVTEKMMGYHAPLKGDKFKQFYQDWWNVAFKKQ